MNPLAIFMRLLWKVSIDSGKRFENRPGAVIERLNDADREELKNLKSSDIDGSPSNDKIENIGLFNCFESHYQKQEFEKDKAEFNKKLKK
jgi:hypothetical protein